MALVDEALRACGFHRGQHIDQLRLQTFKKIHRYFSDAPNEVSYFMQ
jgi:hypothetical protein